mmetsp:Transcript_7304/g.17006  ORF Transcript_7304/g.17006 Transcript_7304/m.17006 type:complete len:106 (+) Transcript_7304:78-395(+)
MSLKIRTLWFEPSMELTVLSPTSNEANLLKPWIVMSSFLHNVILSIDFFPNKEHANIPQHSSSRLLFAKEISARLKVLHRTYRASGIAQFAALEVQCLQPGEIRQ